VKQNDLRYFPETSVVDPHLFDENPDSTCHPDADPDPNFQIKAQTLEMVSTQIGSYSIHFGFSSEN
jgi:hypothetical protein